MAFTAALALGACAAPRRACEIAAPRAAQDAPFLWRVYQPYLRSVVWLYGTIRDGDARVPAAAWAALESAEVFVSELGETRPGPEELRWHVLFSDGDRLDKHLPAEDWDDLRTALRGTVPEDVLRRVRPWYAMTQLAAVKSPAASPSMEAVLARRARELRTPIEALGDEKVSQQLGEYASSFTIADLQRAIRERHSLRDSMQCSAARMRAVYEAGDLEGVGRQLGVDRKPIGFPRPSHAWVMAVRRYVAVGSAFMAISVGYLGGPEGLVADLRREGFVVERVPAQGELAPRLLKRLARSDGSDR